METPSPLLSSPRHRVAAYPFIEKLRASTDVLIVDADRDTFDKGLELYNSRSDKNWSLTDCTSLVVMRERNVSRVLTRDRHFEQAGFVALIK